MQFLIKLQFMNVDSKSNYMSETNIEEYGYYVNNSYRISQRFLSKCFAKMSIKCLYIVRMLVFLVYIFMENVLFYLISKHTVVLIIRVFLHL